VATTIPVPIKQHTATIERIDNLGNPHTPCPLVQPFPILVPNPTNRPANGAPTQPMPVKYYGGSNATLAPEIIEFLNIIIYSKIYVSPYIRNIIVDANNTDDIRANFQ